MARKKKGKGTRKRSGSDTPRTLTATYPSGRKETVPDDGRSFPKGTMLVWNEERSGRNEMRWCVTGGGWPFDD